VSLYSDRMRISPTIFNHECDIERLLEGLS
jgi:selenocysteine lyase/cysteine desulfurase